VLFFAKDKGSFLKNIIGREKMLFKGINLSGRWRVKSKIRASLSNQPKELRG